MRAREFRLLYGLIPERPMEDCPGDYGSVRAARAGVGGLPGVLLTKV
jgi:hypothetical protein